MICKAQAAKFFKIAIAMAFTACISACGGSDTSTASTAATTAATSTSTTASATTTTGVSSTVPSETIDHANTHCLQLACTVEFASATYSVKQGARHVLLVVTRQGQAGAAISIDYSTADGTAKSGVDYKKTAGTMHWVENDTTQRVMSVPISDLTPFSGNKTFKMVMSDPSAAAHIGTPDTATITISGDATASAGAVSLSAASYAVAQSTGSATISVSRAGGSNGAAKVGYTTTNGSAVGGTNFTPMTGNVEWADGDATNKTIVVPVNTAAPFVGSKSFGVALLAPADGATIATPRSASVTIAGDGSAPVGTLEFSVGNYPVLQNVGALTVTVNRIDGSSGALSVAYGTNGDTAVSGTDFSAVNGTLTWADGDVAAKTFTVPVSNASPFSGNKVFDVVLSAPSAGATIGSPGIATVTIAGDAVAPVGSLLFSAAKYSVAQGAGAVTVTVDRNGGSSGAVSVQYATSNGTAVAGTDFTATNGSLTWANGDATAKTFSVPVSNATPFAGNKSFALALSGAGGGATLGGPSSAGVVITGDAVAAVGSLQIGSASYSVAQSTGTVAVIVNRTGGSSGAVSVAYTTVNGTAVAGTNYSAASGTVDWADGDPTSKSISVTINEANPFSGKKAFSLSISSPSGGATLSTPSSTTISITGSADGDEGAGSASAVTNLQLINQGGPNNKLNGGYDSITNYQKISWNAATPGANPIASYNVYRNGVLYANTTALSYTDSAATNSNSPTWVSPATVYSYNVAAVDTAGNVGPQAAQMSVYGYQNGVSNWGNADLSYGGATVNYASTAGSPQGGPVDIAVNFPGSGGFLPVADAPQAPTWDLELGAFNYFVIDINPGNTTNYEAQMNIRTRTPPGDIYGWVPMVNVFDYGPAPKPNTWASYKIPFTVLNMGIGHFTGSISGTTLTVTGVASGVVDAGGFVTGPGVPQGSYVVGFAQHGSIGTFTLAGPNINGSTSVPSTEMTWQRTAMYKFGIQPNTGTEIMYINNMGFTVN